MFTYFEGTLILVLAVGLGCLTWVLLRVQRHLGSVANNATAQTKATREAADRVGRTAQDLAHAVEGIVSTLKSIETGRAASSVAGQSALSDMRESLRAAIATLSGPLTTLATESVDQREVTRSIRDLLAKAHDALDRQAAALGSSNSRLAEVVTRLDRLASVTDESARLLHRAADDLLKSVAAEIARNGEGIQRLCKTIGDDIARLPAE